MAAALLAPPAAARDRAPCAGADLPLPVAGAAQAADAIDCLVDEQRARFGLGALSRDARLDAAAVGHAAGLLASGLLSHTSADASGPGERIAAQGYPWAAYGENVAPGQATAREVMAGWMASAGHCRNVLAPTVAHLGVGVAVGDGGPVYAQVLASTSAGDGAPGTAAAGCPYALDGPVPDAVVAAPAPDAWAPGADPAAAAPPAAEVPAVTVRLRVRRVGRAWRVKGTVRPASPRRVVAVRVGSARRRVVARGGRFAVRVRAGRAARVRVSARAGGVTGRAVGAR